MYNRFAADNKLKKNITTKKTSDVLSALNSVVIQDFNWKGDDNTTYKSFGFDASLLTKSMPSNLTVWDEQVPGSQQTDSNGFPIGQPQYEKVYGINNDLLVVANTASIKELNALIQDLTTRVLSLEKKTISIKL